jgi:protein kinase C substrate 80K-H
MLRGGNIPNVRNVISKVNSKIKYFPCVNGETKDAIENDDYCDCSDGSDEVDTGACSFVTPKVESFSCRFDPTVKIYASRVGDFVCDCEDGSDELFTLKSCRQDNGFSYLNSRYERRLRRKYE